jgi:hypothetical protein
VNAVGEATTGAGSGVALTGSGNGGCGIGGGGTTCFGDGLLGASLGLGGSGLGRFVTSASSLANTIGVGSVIGRATVARARTTAATASKANSTRIASASD